MAAKGFYYRIPQIAQSESEFTVVLKAPDFPRSLINNSSGGFLTGGGNLRIYTDNTKTTRLPVDVVRFVTGFRPRIQVEFTPSTLNASDAYWIEADDIEVNQPAVDAAFGRHAAHPYTVYHLNDGTDAAGNGGDLAIGTNVHTSMLNGKGVRVTDAGLEGDGTDPYFDFSSVGGYRIGLWVNIDESNSSTAAPAFFRIGNGTNNIQVQRSTNKYYLRYRHSPALVDLLPEATWTIPELGLIKLDFVWTGTQLLTYVNAKLFNSVAFTTAPIFSGTDYKVCVGSVTGTTWLCTGLYDEFKIERTARSAQFLLTELENQRATGAWGKVGDVDGAVPNLLPYYVVTKASAPVITRPAEMTTGAGPYLPCIINADEIRAVDSRFPARFNYMLLCSTDHASGSGGIWAFFCTGDPKVAANWLTYDEALTAGDFDYLTTKPASNPIFVVSSQTETPYIKRVGAELLLTTHDNNSGNYGGKIVQNTQLSISSDGINFTYNKVLLTYDNRLDHGDGHTGYFCWRENPIVEIPYNYMGYSTYGGAGWQGAGLWVSNDAKNWTLHGKRGRQYGSIVDGVQRDYELSLDARLNADTIMPNGDGTYTAIVTMKRNSTLGGDIDLLEHIQVIMESDGITFSSYISEVNPKGGVGEYDQYGNYTPQLFEHNGNKLLVYNAQDSTETNSITIADVAVSQGYIPALNIRSELPTISLGGLSSLPPDVLEYGTDGVITYEADRIDITIPAGGISGLVFPQFDSADTDFFEFYFEDIKQNNTEKVQVTIGMFADPSLLLTNTDYAAFYNGDALVNSKSSLISRAKINNIAIPPETYTTDKIGYGAAGIAKSAEDSTALKSYGVRFDGVKRRVVILGLNKAEHPSIDVANVTVPLTGLLHLENKGTAPTTFSIYKMSYDGPEPVNNAPTAVAGVNSANVGPNETFTLSSAGSSDPDAGNILGYSWTQTAGDTVTFSPNSAAENPSVIAPSKSYSQVLTFQLIVNDGELFSAPVTVDVNVAADITKPVIVLSPATLTYNKAVGDSFTLPTATLTDNVDSTISISPVSNNVNMSAEGTYTVVYSGYQDAASNIADAVTVNVLVTAAGGSIAIDRSILQPILSPILKPILRSI